MGEYRDEYIAALTQEVELMPSRAYHLDMRYADAPEVLVCVERSIFDLAAFDYPLWEGEAWARECTVAIKPGSDLDRAWPAFAIRLLEQAEHSFSKCTQGDARKAIRAIAALYRRVYAGRVVHDTQSAEAAATVAATAPDDAAIKAARNVVDRWGYPVGSNKLSIVTAAVEAAQHIALAATEPTQSVMAIEGVVHAQTLHKLGGAYESSRQYESARREVIDSLTGALPNILSELPAS